MGSVGLKKSRNGDTLGPVELIVWPEQANQGDLREQDDQGEVSIIKFGMNKSSGFQKYVMFSGTLSESLSLSLSLSLLLSLSLYLYPHMIFE